jgi:hypothetical protein
MARAKTSKPRTAPGANGRAAPKKPAQPLAAAQRLGSLLKSARDIMRKDKGLNGDLDLHQSLFCGFCIGGHVLPHRSPEAYELRFHAAMSHPEPPIALEMGRAKFWGWQNLIERVLWGVDDRVFGAVLSSGKWTGTNAELAQVLLSQSLGQPYDLPLREAIDWVHASIYTTIKAMKFSHWKPYCGGPIEVAAISTDRRFRWVRHKNFGAALC